MLYYRGKNKKVIRAVELANYVLSPDSDLYLRIQARESFTGTNATPEKIARQMKISHKTEAVEVVTYWSHWFSKAIGYFTSNRPNNINTSTRFINRRSTDVFELAGHFVHEFVHAVDHYDTSHYFGHEYKNPDKKNSAPYWIGYMATYLLRKKFQG